MLSGIGLLVVVVIVSIVGLWFLFYFIPVGLWFQAVLTGTRVALLQLIFMRWRRVPPAIIVNAMISAKKAGIDISSDLLEAHFLAGGHIQNVVNALISADKANIPLDFNMATAIDLAGRNVFEAVTMSVNPKVIDTPPVTAVSQINTMIYSHCGKNINPMV